MRAPASSVSLETAAGPSPQSSTRPMPGTRLKRWKEFTAVPTAGIVPLNGARRVAVACGKVPAVPEPSEIEPPDPSRDLPAAAVLAVLTFLIFAGLMAALITRKSAPETVAWVGAGLVGLGSLVLAAWALVLNFEPDLGPAERIGGDLLLAGFGVLFVLAGLPTFAAGMI